MGPPPCSRRGSPPASSSIPRCPASASRAANVPPPAPEPTTTNSGSGIRCQILAWRSGRRDGGASPQPEFLKGDGHDHEGYPEPDQRRRTIAAEMWNIEQKRLEHGGHQQRQRRAAGGRPSDEIAEDQKAGGDHRPGERVPDVLRRWGAREVEVQGPIRRVEAIRDQD